MPEHNDDTIPVKDLKTILEQRFGHQIEIEKTEWKHLTDPGENYGSLILAIDVMLVNSSQRESLHVVAKLPPTSSYLLQLFNSPATFRKELAFYRDLTPEFLQLQRETGIHNPELSWLGPNFIGGRIGLNDTGVFDNQACILLENLNYGGYRTVDRVIGLNKQQTEFALRQLAKLHATGMAMRQMKPKLFMETVLPALANAVNETAKQCLMDMIKKSLDDLATMSDAKPYINIVKKTIEDAAQMEINPKQHNDKWLTVVHNDFWVNNMMFKFNETNDVVDMKILDFQLCGCDYGLKDIIFFLMSSPMNEIIDNNLDDMIDIYYDALIVSLRAFKIDVMEYPKNELINLMNECASQKLAQCLMMAQVIKSEPGSAPKMESIDNKETFLLMGAGKAHYKKLLQILNVFRQREWLLNECK